MNIIFVGPSGSGKTYIRDYICGNFRYDKAPSITTRDKRDGEIDGEDYRFVSKTDFLKMVRDGDIIEHTEYCGNLYGTHINDVCNDLNCISILTPDGLEQIKKYCNECISFYIDSDEYVRRYRMTVRGDTAESIENRINSDKTVFDKNDDCIDFIVNNNSEVEDIVPYIMERISEV